MDVIGVKLLNMVEGEQKNVAKLGVKLRVHETLSCCKQHQRREPKGGSERTVETKLSETETPRE